MTISRLLLPVALICFILTFSFIFLLPVSVPFSPLSSSSPHPKYSIPYTSYIIVGFLPYWNLKKVTPAALTNVTHLAYFGLLLSGDGSLYTKINRREEDPGYTNYKRILSHTIDVGNKPLTLTFMPESQAALAEILTTKNHRQACIHTIVNALQESRASGINIDFEPLGEISPSLRDDFTLFIQELRSELHKLDSSKLLTISIYASASIHPRIWDLENLAGLADYFVVMTYDYTMPITDNVGPNAPLRGSGQLFDNDITKNIAEISKQIPSGKILLGIPFYGYEWKTADTTKYATSSSRGAVASLERIQAMLDDQTLELLWDRNTLTPYGIASISGETSQIYFENIDSIRLKLEFVRSARLGGIAIWALGYEGNNPDLWQSITGTLSSRPEKP